MTTLELVAYYANLLIYQYRGKPKAYSTIQALAALAVLPQTSIQELVFSEEPVSGTFTLTYGMDVMSALSWDASVADIQTALNLLTGLGSVVVTGSIASMSVVVTFVGVAPPAMLLLANSSLLDVTGASVAVAITDTDVVLPLAVQDGFNLIGPNLATGVQLDILGKYVGVSRSGVGMSGPITLGDSDFYTLIQFALIVNNAESDLSTIVNAIYNFFGMNILVFDYKNMQMSYLISSSVGSQDLIQLLVADGLLPSPMAVAVSVVYAPDILNFFGFVSYEQPVAINNRPFNTYEDYHFDWPWLDYNNTIFRFISLETEDGDILTQENGDALYIG